MLKFFRKPFGVIIILVVIVGAVGAWQFFGREQKLKYEFVVAEKRDLAQEVSVTGRVKPAESVDLSFEKSGKVERVLAKVGQKVKTGQALVSLENSELSSQLREAEANVKVHQAKLDELKLGVRIEEIQVQETKVANAKVALEDAKQNLTDKLDDSFTKSDDAVRNKVDQFFINPSSANPQIFQYLNVSSYLENDLEQGRVIIENILKNWQDSLVKARENLSQIKSFLDKAGLAINSADISIARTNINTAINNLTLANEKFKKAESDLTLAEQELILKKAGPLQEQISGQEAEVEKAQSQVENLKIQINKTTLSAPINGVITKQDAKIGQIISTNVSVVSIISESKFEVEADAPEADIAKIKVGGEANITLDAFGNDVIFKGIVVFIDPAEKIIEGVATYKITLQFLEKDDRVRSGMTANIDIAGFKKQGALAIPQRTIIVKNGDKFVNVLEDGKPSQKKITTGFRGSDGYVEIVAGIKEGDKVITANEK